MAQTQSRPNRLRNVKPRHTYREVDSDTDIDSKLRTHTRPRSTRSSQRIQTYRELSTTNEENSTSSASESESTSTGLRYENPSIGRKTRASKIRKSHRTRDRKIGHNSTATPATLNSFKRQKLAHAKHVDGKASKDNVGSTLTTPLNTSAPPWQTLEYHILLKVMQYAAHPLYSSVFGGHSSIEWLLGVSRLSRSFYDAAMAALLWEPPLMPVNRAHGLVTLLAQDPNKLTINYRTKIRSLSIEVKSLLVKKAGININDILKHVPLLTHLRIFHGHDEMIGKAIWAEPTVSHFKWAYGHLFECLDGNKIRLKSFEWNGRFQDTIDLMPVAHSRPCMSTLEDISIVNFNFTDKVEPDRIHTRDCMISSFIPLRSVRNLEFRNCTLLDSTAMSQLPVGLKSLKIVNCLSLTSEAVELYLTLGGHSLHSLHLEGNQVMDLAFVPKLSTLCPRLEALLIDLSYEDCSSYRDRNPLYDELLPNGSPTWPSSLSSIVVGPLRSLDIADAEDFYTSLINAAPCLPFLRILSIKTILTDASWRDRAGLRKKWQPLFEKVFAAKKTYIPVLCTRPNIDKARTHKTQRKSARLQEMEETSTSDDMDDGDLATGSSKLPRQNRCEIVEFDLSDQRPTQEQFREADFLDSEPSGDDEWNG